MSYTRKQIDQPIVFNSRAIREELKENFELLEFWTCTLEMIPAYNFKAPSYRRANVFYCEGTLREPLQSVIDFTELAKDEESPMSQLPAAALTIVIGAGPQGFKKLCEITSGTITPETYKALQAFMLDIQLNTEGLNDWFNKRGDSRWQQLLG